MPLDAYHVIALVPGEVFVGYLLRDRQSDFRFPFAKRNKQDPVHPGP